ncbi:LOW QUALITY PROTEIN: tripartite motif-containing 13 [Syngnathus typhle]
MNQMDLYLFGFIFRESCAQRVELEAGRSVKSARQQAPSCVAARARASCQHLEPNMEQLEEELTCPIWSVLFEDSRVLYCSDSFFRKCLLESPRGSSFSRSPFRCPSRKESSNNGANSLHVTYSLRDRLKVAPKTGLCAHHTVQPLNMFCATDLRRLFCGCCATADENRGHRYCSLEEAHEIERRAFDELLRGAEGWPSVDALASMETLQAAKKDAERNLYKLAAALENKNEILCDLETHRLAVMQAHDPEMTRLPDRPDRQRADRRVTEPLGFLEHLHDFR